MYAVIFKATIDQLDETYSDLAGQLRETAISDYGCLDFISLTEGDREIAISYWPDMDAIRRWKQDALHLKAQSLGRQTWYKHYSVEIAEIKRHYTSS